MPLVTRVARVPPKIPLYFYIRLPVDIHNRKTQNEPHFECGKSKSGRTLRSGCPTTRGEYISFSATYAMKENKAQYFLCFYYMFSVNHLLWSVSPGPLGLRRAMDSCADGGRFKPRAARISYGDFLSSTSV